MPEPQEQRPLSDADLAGVGEYSLPALSSREIMRVMPAFIPPPGMPDPGNAVRTIENAAAVTALAACGLVTLDAHVRGAIGDVIEDANIFARAMDDVMRRTPRGSLESAMGQAARAAARSVATVTETTPASRVAAYRDVLQASLAVISTLGNDAGLAAVRATWSDYRALAEQSGPFVSPSFFARPLWPDGEPDEWEKVRRFWQRRLDDVGAGAVARRYERVLGGAGIDWDTAASRLADAASARRMGSGYTGESAWFVDQIRLERLAAESERLRMESALDEAGRLRRAAEDERLRIEEHGRREDAERAEHRQDEGLAGHTAEDDREEERRYRADQHRVAEWRREEALASPEPRQDDPAAARREEPMPQHATDRPAAAPQEPASPDRQSEHLARARPQPRAGNGGPAPQEQEGGQLPLASPPTPAPAPARVVNTGVAPAKKPLDPVHPSTPLRPAAEYLFWLEVGPKAKRAIDTRPEPIPVDKLPTGAELDVVLFAVPGGRAALRLRAGQTRGRLRLLPDGRAVVSSPASRPRGVDRATMRHRLFFRFRTPARKGETHRMRCCMYYRNILVQSRLVTMMVGAARSRRGAARRRRALRTDADYTIARRLTVDQIETDRPQRLALMVNGDGNGTHEFFFRALQDAGGAAPAEEFTRVTTLGEGDLADLVRLARGSLRRAAWGTDKPWKPGLPYLYEDRRDPARLRRDLALMATRGYTAYDSIIESLSGSRTASDRLREIMRPAGQVQVASRYRSRLLVPVGLFYDYPLTPQEVTEQPYPLCPGFLRAAEQPGELGGSACWTGRCPTLLAGNRQVVCPSGFWGFRHAMGMPLSMSGRPARGSAPADAPAVIGFSARPSFTAGFSTDPELKEAPAHQARLRRIFGAAAPNDERFRIGASRDQVLDNFKTTRPHLVYFYCHGERIVVEGEKETVVPCLVVGPRDSKAITRADLRDGVGRFDSPRPLVVINGCHTTALEPESALDFVSGFVEVANAVGVIGTEITVFEPLACPFAEEMLERLVRGEQIGWAIRDTRLSLLKAGNPLGLAYLAFVLPGLRFRSDS